MRGTSLIASEDPSASAVAVVLGTRPEAIKLCPVIRELRLTAGLDPLVVTTGQHIETVDEVMQLFGVKPDVRLLPAPVGRSMARLTANCIEGVAEVLARCAPDVVLVQGDTTTTLAASLAAFYARCPLVHLEAGLRSDDFDAPFPEEMNRRLVSQLAKLHLAPMPRNRDRLVKEGVRAEHVAVIGNTVIDALREAMNLALPWHDPALEALDDKSRVVLVTAHRRESWGEPIRGLASAIGAAARRHSDVRFVWSLHGNPEVQHTVRSALDGLSNVILTQPLSYGDFATLLGRAELAVTDSGGVQEEAPAVSVPVLVFRDVTERTEAIELGTARLVGTQRPDVERELVLALETPRPRQTCSPYGDGKASKRAVAAIGHLLGRAERLPDYVPPASAG